jgi:tetratricopeptide (TPR) repeat protein
MKWLEAIASVVVLGAAASGKAPTSTSTQDAFTQSQQFETAQNYSEAIRVLLPIYQKSQRDYTVNLRLGWLYYVSGSYANARQHYELAVFAAPKAVEPRVGLLLPILALGRYADAEIAAREAVRLDANNYYANLRLAYSLRMQLKFPQAEMIDRHMLELYPTDKSFLLEAAYAQWGRGNYREAEKNFRQVLLLDPTNALAQKGLPQMIGATAK